MAENQSHHASQHNAQERAAQQPTNMPVNDTADKQEPHDASVAHSSTGGEDQQPTAQASAGQQVASSSSTGGEDQRPTVPAPARQQVAITNQAPTQAPAPAPAPTPAPAPQTGVFEINPASGMWEMRASQAGTASTTAPSAATASSVVAVSDIRLEADHFLNSNLGATQEQFRGIRAVAGQLMPKLYESVFSKKDGFVTGKQSTRVGDIILSYVLEWRANTKEPDEDALNWMYILGGILMLKPRPSWVFELGWNGFRLHGSTTMGDSKPETKTLDDPIRGKRWKLEDHIQFQEWNTEYHVPIATQCLTKIIWFIGNGTYDFNAKQRFLPIFDDYIHPYNVPYRVIGSARSVASLQGLQYIEEKKSDYRKAHANRVVEQRILEVEEEERQAEARREEARREAWRREEDRRRRDAVARQRQAAHQEQQRRDREEQARRAARQGNRVRVTGPQRNGDRPPPRALQTPGVMTGARGPAPPGATGRQGGGGPQPRQPPARQVRSEIRVDYGDGPVPPPAPRFQLQPNNKRTGEPADDPRDTKRQRELRNEEWGISTLANHVTQDLTDLSQPPKLTEDDDKENKEDSKNRVQDAKEEKDGK